MEITQRVYVKTEPPKDREILARFKPTGWAHLVKWNDDGWQMTVGGRILINDDFIDWSEND